MLYSMHLHHTIILGTVRTLDIWISFLTLYIVGDLPPLLRSLQPKKE